MPVLLAIEASHAEATLALCRDGQVVDAGLVLPRKDHARALLPEAQKFLKAQDVALSELNAIVTTHGPGSFTGIRIGLAAALGLGLGANVKVAAYSVFEVLAHTAFRQHPDAEHCAVVMDARRGMVYLAVLTREGLEYVVKPVEVTPEEAQEILCHAEGVQQPKHLVLDAPVDGDPSLSLRVTTRCGDGQGLISPSNIQLLPALRLPSAAMLADLALAHYPHLPGEHSLTPLYIRPPDAKVQSGLIPGCANQPDA